MFFDLSLVQEIQRYGLTKGSMRILNGIGLNLIQRGSLPAKGPTLIISNHAGMPDTLILFATTNRDDLFQVALSTYRDILEKLGLKIYKKFIPIYRNATYRDIILKIMWGDTHKYLQRNKHKARDLNKESISRAYEALEAGNAVAIFPQGSVGRPVTATKWKAGVGYLIKQIKRDDVQIVFAAIAGTAMTDMFRFAHPLRPLFKNKKITVGYSEPSTLAALGVDVSQSGKEITRQIEQKYYEDAKTHL